MSKVQRKNSAARENVADDEAPLLDLEPRELGRATDALARIYGYLDAGPTGQGFDGRVSGADLRKAIDDPNLAQYRDDIQLFIDNPLHFAELEAGPGGLQDGEFSPEDMRRYREQVLHTDEFDPRADAEAARQLERSFGAIDENGGDKDGFITLDDLEKAANDDSLSPGAREAASRFVENDYLRGVLDHADEGGEVDGKISTGDAAALAAQGSQVSASKPGRRGLREEETVTVYRVEGHGNTRITPDAQGDPHASKSKHSGARRGSTFVSSEEQTFQDVLFVTLGDRERAEEFARKRAAQGLEGTTIKSFEIPKSLADSYRKSAVPEREAAKYPDRPFQADAARTNDSFGLRWPQVRKMNEQAIEGTFKGEVLGKDGAFHEVPKTSPFLRGELPRATHAQIDARGAQILKNLSGPAEGEARIVQIGDAAHFVAANPGTTAGREVRERLTALGVEAGEEAASGAARAVLDDPATGAAAVRASEGAGYGAAFKYAGRAFLVVGALADGYKIYSADDKVTAGAEVAGGWTGALGGAELGATLGTVVGGPIGAAIGGFVGGALGYFGGSVFGHWVASLRH